MLNRSKEAHQKMMAGKRSSPSPEKDTKNKPVRFISLLIIVFFLIKYIKSFLINRHCVLINLFYFLKLNSSQQSGSALVAWSARWWKSVRPSIARTTKRLRRILTHRNSTATSRSCAAVASEWSKCSPYHTVWNLQRQRFILFKLIITSIDFSKLTLTTPKPSIDFLYRNGFIQITFTVFEIC